MLAKVLGTGLQGCYLGDKVATMGILFHISNVSHEAQQETDLE